MVFGPLPPELLLEVISHLPQTYSSYESHAFGTPRLVFTREDALRVLCSTSHRLRLCCFPSLWERFYAEPLACTGAMMLTSHAVNTPLRRLRRLLLAPHLWPHIRFLSVAFLRNDVTDDGTISALIQLLQRLPMLLSLTFSTVYPPQAPLVLSAVENNTFYDIRELAIGNHELGTPGFFRAFPNVDKLRIPWGRMRAVICLESAGMGMHNLTWLSFITLGEPVAAAIVQHCPRVQRIDFALCPDRDQLVVLRRLPELNYLSFRFASFEAAKAPPFISLSQAVLRATQAIGRKVVRIDWVTSYQVNIIQSSDFHIVKDKQRSIRSNTKNVALLWDNIRLPDKAPALTLAY
ncbi:hypothetical protein MIND_01204800 [Mycena indigotica]|uniref:F-box domain-containing protein n=1 Tax=Mycena indigotica TaxID=2126181 RepID=A0A8H6VT82_9AGAR|nr:uncharacterized protein MIND_01204800 [Mycena indigotica]KAF7293054.1 hypothetical protein MIND_01204800 [Mycena indigotica]